MGGGASTNTASKPTNDLGPEFTCSLVTEIKGVDVKNGNYQNPFLWTRWFGFTCFGHEHTPLHYMTYTRASSHHDSNSARRFGKSVNTRYKLQGCADAPFEILGFCIFLCDKNVIKNLWCFSVLGVLNFACTLKSGSWPTHFQPLKIFVYHQVISWGHNAKSFRWKFLVHGKQHTYIVITDEVSSALRWVGVGGILTTENLEQQISRNQCLCFSI